MRKMLVLAPMILIACGFAPEEGEWQPTLGATVVDECGFGDLSDGEQEDPFSLTLGEDDTFTFGDTECTLDGADFSCDVDPIVTPIDGLDATLTTNTNNSGTFDGSDMATGTSTTNITCEGADCEAFASVAGLTLPCTSTYEYDVALVAAAE